MADGNSTSMQTSNPIFTVAVRALCAFCEKRGDLDRRFTPAPTALQGIAGHGKVTSSRPDGYERELLLSGVVRGLTIRGRADGFDPERQCLEEIKTHRGDAARIPANHRHLHWAQAKVYGALLCRMRAMPALDLSLVYFNIDDDTETVLTESFQAETLFEFLDGIAETYRLWAEQEAAHRITRNAAISRLVFPHADFNSGQRALAEAVFRCATQKTPLLIQAPTGIGKTVGTLFPALKACTRAPIDKLYFLTAKTPGRLVALEALALIQSEHRPLRVLELVSRDKSCVYPDRRCNGDSCPLASGFYDRLPAARAAAVKVSTLDQSGLRTVAAEHGVCPYYLGQEMIRWADVVVGDYNYYFDTHAVLHALQADHEWNVAVLVDEAHNLVDRARDMYSATINSAALAAARKHAPSPVKATLGRLLQAINHVDNQQTSDYSILDGIPERLTTALSEFITAAAKFLSDTADEFPAELQQFFFDSIGFARLAETFGPHSMVDSASQGLNGVTISIRNIVPAPFVGPRLAAAHGAALFSATLNPPDFYGDLLGMPASTPWLDVASPFAPEQLSVRIARHISTRYEDRAGSIDPIVDILHSQFSQQPGNYLAFFSSFEYLDETTRRLRSRYPDLPFWSQERRMDEAARSAFLDRFTADGSGIGFAVLGGVFSEGVDLPGKRLIGAFVVTLGIPQVNPINEAMAERMTELFGSGFEYTYLYPGLRKVVQAAGRVIRNREDRGTVILVDRRYARPDVQALLPSWWQL